MSDKSDETQSHNSGNEEQGTEDNQKVEQNAPEQPVDKNVKVLKGILATCRRYRDDLTEFEKLKLSTLEAPVFYSYYELWSEESNKLFKRSAILKRRYKELQNKKEQVG